MKTFISMRRIATLFLSAFTLCNLNGYSQYLFPQNIYSLRQQTIHNGGNRDVIWSEDFSNGLPADWLNDEATGIAQWEYRGPNTTPNNEIGSRGSCQIAGVPGQQILSPSWQNGFMIFDSNYWDNDSLPCSEENFGTGIAPGPHLAVLTTPPIDLSTFGNIALTFHHYLNTYSANARVDITTDGINWYPIYTAPATPNPTTPIDSVIIQISSQAAFQPLVQFRFVFEGMYYYWQLDDIKIIETNINDIAISNCDYGEFNLTDPSHPTGFEYLPYSLYPTQMPPLLKFKAQATNMGSAMAVGCGLQAQLYDTDNNQSIFSGVSSELTDLPSGVSTELRAGMFQVADTNRNYRIDYSLYSTATDQQSADNYDTITFAVNPYVYARDRLSAQQVYMGNVFTQNNSYDVANAFLITAPYICHSILVAPAAGTMPNASVRGRLYELGDDNINASILIAESESVIIDANMINQYGDNNTIALPFTQTVTLDSGKVYLATAGSEMGSGSFVCALSGNSPAGSSFVRATQGNTDVWFSLSRTPMVRLNAEAPAVAINETNSESFQVYPNPANDKIHITLNNTSSRGAYYLIMNLTADVVSTGRVSAQSFTVDCQNLTSGLYHIIIVEDDQVSAQKFVVNP